MNYYRRYVGDYLKKTIRLSMTEHGAYGLLLDFYYAEEKPIPLDVEEVYVICRAVRPDDQKAVQKVLGAYFTKAEDGWHNQRADEEIAAAVQARENGGRGGRPPKHGTGIQTGKVTGPITGSGTGSITGNETETGGQTLTGSGHPPTSNHQPPTTNRSSLQPSTSSQGQPRSPGASPPVARKGRRNGADDNIRTSATWNAYSTAYFARYGTEPVRNATVNGQLAQFVKRIGTEESPSVAAFYVGHDKAFYVGKKHPVGLMLADAEGLRTAWATGRPTTETEARQTDRTAATAAVFDKLIAEAKP
jgi:uncharacterized protein YdaU (DUF1376 family)